MHICQRFSTLNTHTSGKDEDEKAGAGGEGAECMLINVSIHTELTVYGSFAYKNAAGEVEITATKCTNNN